MNFLTETFGALLTLKSLLSLVKTLMNLQVTFLREMFAAIVAHMTSNVADYVSLVGKCTTQDHSTILANQRTCGTNGDDLQKQLVKQKN
jgi:hypothetical protein